MECVKGKERLDGLMQRLMGMGFDDAQIARAAFLQFPPISGLKVPSRLGKLKALLVDDYGVSNVSGLEKIHTNDPDDLFRMFLWQW